MTREEIIDGLKFTVDMFLFNPSTGETFTEPRNDMDKTTIDACKGAIELLEQTYDWCKGCKEYDNDKHCCHRYSSFIRESLQENINAVLEDIKTEMEKEQAECPYPLDIEHAITIIDKYISRKE